MITSGRILERLKHDTAAHHAAAEQQLDLDNRLRNSAAYAALLGRLYGFYQPLETALGRVDGYEELGIHFEERSKALNLAKDLAALGQAIGSFPLCPAPRVPSLGDALGRMYVLEGATLGGRIVSRMVEARLGYTAERGGAFFTNYGDRVGAMWTAFRSALVQFATTPETEQQLVAAATDTFERFNSWLASTREVL
ncbi:heme oxygenase : Heme oxygenase OS=Microvirga lotononidis GN=MicloDRAFT_00059780 PE=4 SV=1: Heme_oxygenase: Heme_oxygenase [Gemmata massiliana]|uniref:Heme oxygenase n=1 Tax=Gemmata massiliana TaxID=1210884 RepID=A0A6P2D3K5_9BACT|nr:biliverdin-producing heme oxygenase [Gemmata massiliana]VTR95891.1 heme oxygenase : Heme oxygenase OS=Microvirga lotononidis GN=MicloDRAFT_00059780 PE=4 SV=1: Heme_oxygenase: Heme_oxygenase [Gemmata massiliana]